MNNFFTKTRTIMSAFSSVLLSPLASFFSTTEDKVFHVVKCVLAFLFLLLCDRILKQHEKSEKEKKAIGEPMTTTDDVMTMKKGDLTRKELKQFDGKSDEKKPFLLLACKGTIFDVTKGRDTTNLARIGKERITSPALKGLFAINAYPRSSISSFPTRTLSRALKSFLATVSMKCTSVSESSSNDDDDKNDFFLLLLLCLLPVVVVV